MHDVRSAARAASITHQTTKASASHPAMVFAFNVASHGRPDCLLPEDLC